jgi:hypothetical protein
MMNTYAETKKELDRIRSEYACKGEMIFRTAIQYVVEYGKSMFEDDEWVGDQLSEVDSKHNAAEHYGQTLWISRDFEKAIIECAREIAKVDTYSLLVYVQKEVWLSNEGGIDYERAVKLLKNCLAWFADDCCGCAETLEKFELLDLDDDEIELLGYGYMFDVREEN